MPTREMLINNTPGQECRIAIIENGRLEELYRERASFESHVGNIYKGRVVHIEPAIQAAFIDFGLERNGFLHLSDLHPMYFGGTSKEESERIGQKTPHRDRPPIQNCLHRGQDILVQVLKEGIGTKGPTLTSYLSIPGRFLVLLPYMERLGVSRKVEDDQSRHEMRKILDELAPPANFGFIIRTAGIGRTKTDLKRDLAYLQRLWKAIEQRMQKTPDVGELYAESDLVIRTIRDVFSTDIDRIVVDDEPAAQRAQNFLSIANPRSGSTVVVYRDPIPLFHRYDIERQIQNIHGRVVPLQSGGSLVIDSTEALVAVDVNSGKNRESRNAETTAYKINLEAADEVCRQLRLRDLGGVVVIDLIDMKPVKHRREVEHRFKNNLKKDRARTQTSSISQFGLLEMTRQRMRPSLEKTIYIDCTACGGAGQVKSPESVVLDAMRQLAVVMHHPKVDRVELVISPNVAFHLLNVKRSRLVDLEKQHGKTVTVRVGGESLDHVQLIAFDSQGGTLQTESLQRASQTTSKESEAPISTLPSSNPTDQDVASTSPARDQPADKTPTDKTPADETPADETPSDAPRATKPRRRRRRRGGRSKASGNNDAGQTNSPPATIPPTDQPTSTDKPAAEPDTTDATDPTPADESAAPNPTSPPPTGRSRRRRRRGGRNQGPKPKPDQPAAGEAATDNTQPNDQAGPPAVKSQKQPKTRRRRSGPKTAQEPTTQPQDHPPKPSASQHQPIDE